MYDVIIVGARVSGGATAMLLARKNVKVLLLDKMSFPSDCLSTHMVQPRGVSYLYRWGLSKELKKITPQIDSFCLTHEDISIRAKPCAKEMAIALQEDHGWNKALDGSDIPVEWLMIRRKILDPLLVNEAIKAGAEFRDQYKVESLILENDRVVGVKGVTSAGKTENLYSKLVIIADGRHSQLMKAVGAKVLKEHHNAEFCYYNYYANLELNTLKYPIHKRGRYAIAYGPTNHNLSLVSIWGPTQYSTDFFQNPIEHFHKTIQFCYPELADKLKQCQPAEEFKGIRNVSNIMRETIGKGWLAMGDASCSLTQTTAVGISNAFRDAELAAHYLTKVGTDISLEEALTSYAKDHYKDLHDYFDYVAQSSECLLPKEDDYLLTQILSQDALQAGRFIGVRARIFPMSHFFNAENLVKLNRLKQSTAAKNEQLLAQFIAKVKQYTRKQPWEIKYGV